MHIYPTIFDHISIGPSQTINRLVVAGTWLLERLVIGIIINHRKNRLTQNRIIYISSFIFLMAKVAVWSLSSMIACRLNFIQLFKANQQPATKHHVPTQYLAWANRVLYRLVSNTQLSKEPIES